jgi:hypothetical protein
LPGLLWVLGFGLISLGSLVLGGYWLIPVAGRLPL